MTQTAKNPRILIVTPEITYLPRGMGNMTDHYSAKAGGLADVSASLISTLYEQGADVHVAIPDYRALFSDHMSSVITREHNMIKAKMPDERVHLAEDRTFFYMHHVYADNSLENLKISLAFQREVINNIIPYVQPDLIHCNDWMTGFIPAMSRQLHIPCLFTVHNIHTMISTLDFVEDRGIDAASFWLDLYYDDMPKTYEETRETINADFLVSGIYASHYVNTVSSSFLREIVEGKHAFVNESIREELIHKYEAGCATGILNAPDPSYNPFIDENLQYKFNDKSPMKAKEKNKRYLQENLGLYVDENAPLFFWPSRLDPVQKGCQLLSEILYDVVSNFWDQGLQIVFIANGYYQETFRDIVRFHSLHNRVAVCNFDERVSRLAYGASDFILMPSKFEPCGLPQMIGPIYGSLPVAHDTGGIHDTITHIDVNNNFGNGFLFEHFDAEGLFWGFKEAMRFFSMPKNYKEQQIKRIMKDGLQRFNHDVTARNYIQLYEKMLKRPLIKRNV